MREYVNDFGKKCYDGVSETDDFHGDLFHKIDMPENDVQFVLHTNLGSITVLDRMTGFGYRDIETGYRDKEGKFWLASGNIDVRYSGCKTFEEAIKFIKEKANVCIGI